MTRLSTKKLVVVLGVLLIIVSVALGIAQWQASEGDHQLGQSKFDGEVMGEDESVDEESQDQEVPQIDTSEGNYIPVELREVLNYSSVSRTTYVKTSGEIVGFEYDTIGATILLSDNSNNYLLVTICHVCVSNYFDLLSTLKNGDQVEVKGAAHTTAPKDSNLKNKFDIVQVLPERIGMVGLDFTDGMRLVDN